MDMEATIKGGQQTKLARMEMLLDIQAERLEDYRTLLAKEQADVAYLAKYSETILKQNEFLWKAGALLLSTLAMAVLVSVLVVTLH